jgi:chromosome partitioning protein
MATKIVFFNHKGGIHTAPMSYNLGRMLGELGHKVLLVDGDPQCHLTNLLLGDDFEKYYMEDSTKYQNIKDGVKVAFEGKIYPIKAVTCFSPEAHPNLFLLAGHANLSEYDATLSYIQHSSHAFSMLQNIPGAFNELLEKTASQYAIDYILIDLNPGLSAINQNLFILSDAFIIPTDSDPFSIMAIQTLSTVLPRWVDWADRMRPMFEEATYPLSNSKPKFIGELIQKWQVRKGKTASYHTDTIAGIKQMVQKQLAPSLLKSKMLFPSQAYQMANIQADFCLAEISDFQEMQPEWRDSKPETMVHRDPFRVTFRDLAQKIIHLNEYAKSA